MNTKIELSEKQSSIVYADNVPLYVKASAGSGKTRVLTERVRHLLSQTNKKVLALTFTNKAGEEIKERLSDIVDLDKRAFIGTFHGFCQMLIENHGSLIGFQQLPHIFESDTDRLELLEQAINQIPSYSKVYNTMTSKEKLDYKYRALSYISGEKRELGSHLNTQGADEDIVLFYQSYQEILYSQNAIDFDDLLLLGYRLLTEYPKIATLYRRSYFSICIDEAQDLNYAQYQLIYVLAGADFKNIMMVGDPNQSIYHFNGSSPDYMNIEFVNDFSPIVIELIENYRSSIAVLSAAKKIMPDAEYIEGTIKSGIFEIFKADDQKDEALWVVNKINKLIEMGFHEDIEGKITYEKIAVLARNKYVFSTIQAAFEDNELPYYYKMTPGAVKFESEIMEIFDLALRVKLNPVDRLHKSHLIKKLKLDVSVNNLKDLMTNIDIISESNIRNILTLVDELRDDGSNLKMIFEKFANDILIEDENEKTMVMNDINELLMHWYNYAKKTDNTNLLQFKNAMALGQTHPLTQHSGITLSTVHTMKGQEFDIVFIIGMDDETFPDYRAIKQGGVELVQEKNNCYVAFTRSKRFLYVTWPSSRMMPWGDMKRRRISRFLSCFQ